MTSSSHVFLLYQPIFSRLDHLDGFGGSTFNRIGMIRLLEAHPGVLGIGEADFGVGNFDMDGFWLANTLTAIFFPC